MEEGTFPFNTKSTEGGESAVFTTAEKDETKKVTLTKGGMQKLVANGPAPEALLIGVWTGRDPIGPKLKSENNAGRMGGEERREEELDW